MMLGLSQVSSPPSKMRGLGPTYFPITFPTIIGIGRPPAEPPRGQTTSSRSHSKLGQSLGALIPECGTYYRKVSTGPVPLP